MTQVGESVAVTVITEDPPPQEEQAEEKPKVKLRLCISFDGTLNNRTNTQAREANNQSYRDAKNSWFQAMRGYGSYENAVSNVAKMDTYIDQAQGYDKTIAIYTEGIGTLDNEVDSFLGKALGDGQTGIAGKCIKALNEIIFKIMDEFEQGEVIFELISLDLFGFSRGAAAARHFINYVLDECDFATFRLSRRLTSANYEVEKIEVSFVGLYDTVSSFGAPFEHRFNSRYLRLNAVSFAKKVVQLAAAEEHRENFSLTNIDSTGGKGTEVFLPGAHSDIGGGYIDGAPESHIINKRLKRELEIDKSDLIAKGWFLDHEISISCPESRSNRVRAGLRICKLKTDRLSVAAKYDRIPLQIMAEFSRDAGLNVKSALEVENDATEDDLCSIKDELKSYAKSGSSKPEDWQGNDARLKALRNKHLHFSAHLDDTGLGPRFINGERKRLYYDG
ncbi:hypothetical protein TDB9533_03482 [Thalassocella blandensis]|nr:hypothetical protein TDB9533_03482 [Thalassocella blandensis]